MVTPVRFEELFWHSANFFSAYTLECLTCHCIVLQIMYLGAASNNMASTTMAFFQESVDKFGVPLR